MTGRRDAFAMDSANSGSHDPAKSNRENPL